MSEPTAVPTTADERLAWLRGYELHGDAAWYTMNDFTRRLLADVDRRDQALALAEAAIAQCRCIARLSVEADDFQVAIRELGEKA